MKRSYNYFIIKPDGIRFLDDICNTLENKFSSIKYYAIDDYRDITEKLYYEHFKKGGPPFITSFRAYLYGLTQLFGNQALLALVSDKDRDYDELAKSVCDTKFALRRKYVNQNVAIVTNVGDGRRNHIRLINEDGKQEMPRIMKTLGSHRISDMNLIHSPDADKDTALIELDILLREGIIDDKNMVPIDMLQKMKKYRTISFQDDMKEKDYQGPIQPDISAFIRNEIKEEYGDDEDLMLY